MGLNLANMAQPEFQSFQVGQRAADQAHLTCKVEESRPGIGLALVRTRADISSRETGQLRFREIRPSR